MNCEDPGFMTYQFANRTIIFQKERVLVQVCFSPFAVEDIGPLARSCASFNFPFHTMAAVSKPIGVVPPVSFDV